MCPQLGHSKYAGKSEYSNYCDVIKGRVKEPEWCWCKTGIALMWMESHKPDEVVDLLVSLS